MLQERNASRMNVGMVKDQSRKLVFQSILNKKGITRLEIAKQTDLSLGTVKTIVEEFLQIGIIKEFKDNSTAVGRKPKIIILQADSKFMIILQLNRLHFKYVLLNLSKEEKDIFIYSIKEDISLNENLQLFLENVKIRLKNLNQENLLGVGVAVPGPYYPETDYVQCSLIPGMEKIQLKSIIREYIDLPVVIGNDVHLSAVAEKEKLDSPDIPLFYLFLSEGVGGAFIEKGHLIKGNNQYAGEVGLINLENGRTIEEMINWLSFIEHLGYKTGDNEEKICTDILKRWDERDKKLVAELEQISEIIAKLIGYIVCILNPGVISIGGKYHFLGERFLNLILSRLNNKLIPDNCDFTLKFSFSQGKGTILGTASHLNNLWLDNLPL